MEPRPSRRRWLSGLLGGWLAGWLTGHLPAGRPAPLTPAPLPQRFAALATDTSSIACTCVYDGHSNRIYYASGDRWPPSNGLCGPLPPAG